MFAFERDMAADGFASLSRPDLAFNVIYLRAGLVTFKLTAEDAWPPIPVGWRQAKDRRQGLVASRCRGSSRLSARAQSGACPGK